MIEDSVTIVEHGPQKVSVEDAMADLGMDFKEIQKALFDRGIEMTNIKKRIPIEAVRSIQRGEAVILGVENENLHWIPKAFIEEFGEKCVKVGEMKDGTFWHIIISKEGMSNSYTFLKDLKQVEGNSPTVNMRDVNQAIYMTRRMFKMVNSDVADRIKEIDQSRKGKGVNK